MKKLLITTVLVTIVLSLNAQSIVKHRIDNRPVTAGQLIEKGAAMNQSALAIQLISVGLGSFMMIADEDLFEPGLAVMGIGSIVSITLKFNGFQKIKLGGRKMYQKSR